MFAAARPPLAHCEILQQRKIRSLSGYDGRGRTYCRLNPVATDLKQKMA
jgi:hypothetical protein